MKLKVGNMLKRRSARSRARRPLAASAGAITALALAGTAFASQGTVPLPYYEQSEDDWCAITCAQMILKFYGSSIQQCEGANLDFGVTTCCANPGSAVSNPGGSFTGQPLEYYGVSFSEYQDNSFSFSQFMSEIQAGRPVSIGWNFSGGGGHAMNVAGYDTNGDMLLVYDPLPGTGCPAGEGECWMSWTAYMGGPGYGHTSQSPLYNLANAPICSSDYFDIPSSETQQCYDTWTHRGRQPAALAATWSNGAVAYSGSYQAASGPAPCQYLGMSFATYQSTFDTLAGQSYRPSNVNVNEFNGTWQVDALFVPTEGPFSSYTGLTASQFASTNTSLTKSGFVVADLFGYSDENGNPYFAATWVEKASSGQIPQTGLPSSEFQATFNSEAAAGRYPARVSAYRNGNTTDYAVVWQNSPAGGFYAANGASVVNFELTDLSVAPDGFHLGYVSALNNSFSGVFVP